MVETAVIIQSLISAPYRNVDNMWHESLNEGYGLIIQQISIAATVALSQPALIKDALM